ncbi:hypothetical protein Patl1_31491 [Pistacia atlantica]|uniref:Uncharacterized protein n=1 Tax=Pistacia atlantica TaxID=434234 RepID=A0ACC1AQZ7_9ROSI|nr:hypothetical protein Patl1_31491 [Pistacia atlantica]
MQVRDKILVLLDSWQEAFGGSGGKHPQYYWAYEELRRSGVQFPQRSPDAAPIFTPPVTHPALGPAQAGYGMPSSSSRRLDETMASEVESLSLSSLDSMRDVMELLGDMLQAVNPGDREAVKDEVIVDLVNQCRSNSKKLMQMLSTTSDEELLGRGLELNDSLQTLLAKHDAIASGSPLPIQGSSSPLPIQGTNLSTKPTEVSSSSLKSTEVGDSSPVPNGTPRAPVPTVTKAPIDEEEEEEDDFAQLARSTGIRGMMQYHSCRNWLGAITQHTWVVSEVFRLVVWVPLGLLESHLASRRHYKSQPVPTQSSSAETAGALVPVENSNTTSSMPTDSTATTPCNALALRDPPAPVRTTKEQDMIDLLSITLSNTSTTPQAPETPSASNQTPQHIPASPNTQGYPYASPTYPGNQGQVPYNNYVAPWAQPQPRPQPQPQPQVQPQYQMQSQPQYPQYASGYPPPPWATTPGYFNNQNHLSTTNNVFSTPRANTAASYTPLQGARTLQQNNSFPTRGINGSATLGDTRATSASGNPAPTTAAQKPFIPSYRLFEDLNVLGSADGRLKMKSSTSPSLNGTGQGMVGGRK